MLEDFRLVWRQAHSHSEELDLEKKAKSNFMYHYGIYTAAEGRCREFNSRCIDFRWAEVKGHHHRSISEEPLLSILH